MDNSKKEYVYELLYSENKEATIEEIKDITDSELLHIIVGNYNWDNGFEIPYSIITNKNCDLGTALMIFYDADGYRVLQDREELKNPNLKEWANFISEIEERILNNKFKVNTIKFIPPLTKVQIFKLKKNNPNISKAFIEESDGDIIEIPNI
ncbi:DUF4274 domain-containing protein [Clostridium sporogenes]|uniref:DUF4274 domain-containing protein n=1 Tax=Clostridium sporogenes TaxID=1509 RepID=UPI00024BB245|nr:DUF4274 domain-containing protein [Clostridium sporogenes]EHN13387.1 hypothetical protein IYC_17830 [Clostridium sporogenes PA 3679]MCW6106995.1 DUF4274 domain-containing protein [Clostridium sporogenes]MDU4600333.1 DUF4274 domain-containing protein [Clostridium sporogenes]NFF65966.1 DUF4274 domain-containing protein [Clostridium sporogenes]NFF98355.1 DUF4274 domain-containing protein [Clostridium sporogenes]